MKHYLCILLFFLTFQLMGQDASSDCAANAGGDRFLCHSSTMHLSAPTNQLYAIPPNITWTYLNGPISPDWLKILNPNDFETDVQHLTAGTWPAGDYSFEFCVDCQETGEGGKLVRPCDIVVITVKPDVTLPVITDLYGNPISTIRGCTDVDFSINSLDLKDDEDYTLTYTPFDDGSDLLVTENGENVTVEALTRDLCDYTFTYTITNQGCTSTATLVVNFAHPAYNEADTIVEGTIDSCPSCSTTVDLRGNSPGCGGTGIWSVVGYPNLPFTNVSESDGTATVTLPEAGHYAFLYTVTNSPCPVSTFPIECDIFDLNTFKLGEDQVILRCDNLLPAGVYPFCFNQIEDVLYAWSSDHPDLTITPGNTACENLVVSNDIDLSLDNVTVSVNSIRFLVDYDCDGPGEYQVLDLPLSDPNETPTQVAGILDNLGYCYNICYSRANIYYYGAPTLNISSAETNFLCTNGTKSIRLRDYFKIVNDVPSTSKVTVISKPACAPALPNSISVGQFLNLDVTNCDGCGTYKFKIDFYPSISGISIPSPCTTSIYLTFNIETTQPAPAGTDQVKCPQETIRLNGDNPYCTVQGTWTRIPCSNLNYYNVSITNIHDPNTPITVTAPVDSICPPDTLCFVWAFTSVQDNCPLSDTTRVIIRDSCCFQPPCPLRLQVKSECHDNMVTLTALDIVNNVLTAPEYIVHWSPMNLSGNPITIPYTGTLHYTAEIFKLFNGDTICYNVLTGTVRCNQTGCGAQIVESCAANGDVIVTLMDLDTGLPVVPASGEDEIWWTVYGGGPNDNTGYLIQMTNPISIQQGACYSLRYTHFEYPPSVPHVLGYHTSRCEKIFPRTCVSIACPGPCSDFNNFMVAGCGDILDVSLNLSFPDGCRSVCSPNGTSVTLGLFQKDPPYAPISPSDFNILWENGSTGTYATAELHLIDRVTVTSKDEDACVWKDGYSAECPCTTEPTNLRCEQPITKYCKPDGSFYYQVGAPQIAWNAVPGATGYVLEITTGTFDGCCSMPANTYQIPAITTTYWSIPGNLSCFSVRVKAVIPYCEGETAWSEAYLYCPSEIVCEQVLTVCGCCHGERDAATAGLNVQVVSEEVLLAYLDANPGTQYPTLQEAIQAAGGKWATGPAFKVFPNPATDQIVIQASNATQGSFSVELSDLLQRQWRKMSFDAADQKTLNVSDLPKGVYLVTIRNAQGDRMMTQKVTIVR